MTDRPDAELVRGYLDGDERAFEVLIQRYQGRLYRFLLGMTRDSEDAADLLQETFYRVFSALDRYDPAYRFSTWIYTIARRLALDHLGSARVRRRAQLTLADERPEDADRAGAFLVPLDRRPWADKVASDRRALARLEAALDEVSESYREVFLMRYRDELDIGEIAEILGLRPGAVKVRLHRARKALLRILGPLSDWGV